MKNKKSRNTQGMRQWKKFKRNKMAVIALILLGILIFASAFAPLLTSYDPEAISLTERTLAPSKTHLLGTDKVGRDVFTRLLYGGRISILIGLTGALGGAIIGARWAASAAISAACWTGSCCVCPSCSPRSHRRSLS